MRKIRRLVALFGGIVVAFCVLELLLRLAWPQVFADHPRYMLSPDPVVGHVLTPGFHGKFERSEFSVDMNFNELGLRDAPLLPKKADTVRIVCLGDSLTWGWGVQAQETYCHLLGKRLGEQIAGVDIQTVNAGVPYYGSNDELAHFLQYGEALQPDYVVLLFNTANDFQQNRASAAERYAYHDGMLQLNRPFSGDTSPRRLAALEALKHRSHVVKLLSENAGYLLMRSGIGAQRDEASGEQVSLAIGLLDELHTASNAVDARLLLAVAPEKSRILGGITSTPADVSAVLAAARDAGNDAVDLGPLMLAHPDRASLYGRYEGYWTAAAHKLVAAALADALSDSFTDAAMSAGSE